MWRAILPLLVVAISARERVAWPHGGPPATAQVVPAPPGRIFVGTNFGLLRSEDDGASWRWICEESVFCDLQTLSSRGGGERHLLAKHSPDVPEPYLPELVQGVLFLERAHVHADSLSRPRAAYGPRK